MNKAVSRLVLAAALVTNWVAVAADEYSAAEQKVFLDNHLKNIKTAAILKYDFKQSGKPEDSFEDRVEVSIKAAGNKGAKTVVVDYLTGAHKVTLPAVGNPEGNPVILYFLEMDVRDMHRLVGGQEAYFRKRIRLALADKAEVRAITINFSGHPVAASEVRIVPYVEDPLKERFGMYAKKFYVFTVSDQVPGGIYQIRTQVDDPAAKRPDAPPLMQSVLTLATAGS